MRLAGSDSIDRPSYVPLWRRLVAIVYDSLAVAAVLFFATLPIVILAGGEPIPVGNPYFTSYLLLVTYGYFAYCWTHGGQTLGMRSWRFKVVHARDGRNLNASQATVRFAVAIISAGIGGLGFITALFDDRKLTWHDYCSHSRLTFVD
jgi:uncharacterized RDD family membrane protein YckC